MLHSLVTLMPGWEMIASSRRGEPIILVADSYRDCGTAAGEHTSAELAELFGVARSTVYPAIERATSCGGSASVTSALGWRQGCSARMACCGELALLTLTFGQAPGWCVPVAVTGTRRVSTWGC